MLLQVISECSTETQPADIGSIMETILPLVISVVSLVLTLSIAVIAYFIKRYIQKTDEENDEIKRQLTTIYDKLSHMIDELQGTIHRIWTRMEKDQVVWTEKFKRIDSDMERINKDIEKLKNKIRGNE